MRFFSIKDTILLESLKKVVHSEDLENFCFRY